MLLTLNNREAFFIVIVAHLLSLGKDPKYRCIDSQVNIELIPIFRCLVKNTNSVVYTFLFSDIDITPEPHKVHNSILDLLRV